MIYRLLLGAFAAAACLYASPASAVGPTACGSPGATTPDHLAGTWHPDQRDDGYEWHDIAAHTFAADGTWSETTTSDGTLYGHWCVVDNVLIWGFDGSTRTTYRVPLGPEPMRGFMSWDGGGTGEVQISRSE
jgi:hypothetical protein